MNKQYRREPKRGALSEVELEDYILQVPSNDWDDLFELIPEIQGSKSFGTLKGGSIGAPFSIMPYYEEEPVVVKFSELVRYIPLMVSYNWFDWEEAKQLVTSDQPDFSSFSLPELCKIVTVIMRGDHFNEGMLVDCFKRGAIENLLTALKKKVSEIKK